MFCTQRRRLLSYDVVRVLYKPAFVVASIAKKPTTTLRFLSSQHFDRNPWTHQPCIATTRQNRLPQQVSPLHPRYFSSAVEEDATEELDTTTHDELERPSGQRTVAEQIDPNGTDLPRHGWVQVKYIPPTSLLEDILNSVAKHLNEEYTSKGIIDLEGYWTPPSDPPMLKDLDTSNCVELAYLMLGKFGRPSGWRLKFKNRSIAHCFLESTKTKPFKCVWRETEVRPWLGRDEELLSELAAQLSDAAVRVENCADDVTEGQCRHLFRRYDLAWEGPSVIQIGGHEVGGRPVPNMFIIRFADASWARAAIRELQGVEFRGTTIKLAQYPKQLILIEKC